jgi:hypothetical protein
LAVYTSSSIREFDSNPQLRCRDRRDRCVVLVADQRIECIATDALGGDE